MPMVPGSQFTLDGITHDDEGAATPHTVVTTVTDLTKVVDGVTTRVM